MKKSFLIIGKMVIFAIIFIALGYWLSTLETRNLEVVLNIEEASHTVDRQYELLLVAADISMYNYLSPEVQRTILTALDSANRRFNIPIGLMHAITRTESEYRFWIDHPTVNVRVKGQLVTTRARGLGGVIWEFWGDSLKAYNIAFNESDLYLPDVGILAEACVLHIIIRDVMRSNPTGMNIITRIQSSYYGAYSDMYMGRMQQVTSDLWLKRMAMEIKNVYTIDADTAYSTQTSVAAAADSLSTN